jgi:outer membrane protein insertion porin family
MRLPLPFVVVWALILACLVVFAVPVFGQEAPAVSEPAAASSAAPEPASPGAPTAQEGASQPAPAEGAAQPAPGAEAAPSLPAELVGEQKEPVLSIPPPPEVLPPIVGVDVVGYERVARDDILKAIKSQPAGQYSEAQAKRDVEAIRSMGWFQRVWQDSVSVENGVNLIFHVIENPVVTDMQFEGNRELTREQLLKVMKTQPGQIYNAKILAQDAQAIENLYGSNGYILAIVVSQKMSDAGVLTLVIAEGEIEDIKITGNTHTKTYAIRRYIRTRVGETYNDRKVARDVGRLNALGWFDTVRRDAEVGTEPGKVIVIITVVERKRTGMASVGGGYSSVQGLVGFVDLTKSNLGGTGQQVSIRGEFGGRTSYELGYQHPWVMTPETRLSAGIYDRLILREAFVTDTDTGERRNILYDERRSGGNLTLGRPLSDRTTVFVGVRSDDISISGVSEDERKLLEDPDTHELLPAFQPRNVRSLTLAAVNDTRNDVYNPRRGSYQRLSAEFAGVFGGVDFNKYVSDSRRFLPLGRRNVLAVRLLAGVVTGEAPYLEQFLIGGSESLRGFRTDRFVGTRMAIMNTEYRFPVSENLLGVLFVDVGDAWGGPVSSDPAFEEIVHDSFTAHIGYGVGVRVKTPIGPLRLDLGFSEEGTETHFGVRHMF